MNGTTFLNQILNPVRSSPDSGSAISRIDSRPPGRRTRAISSNVPARSVKFRRAYPHVTPSKLALRNGSFDASACTRSGIFLPASSIPKLKSVATALCPCFVSSLVKSPVPAAMSRTTLFLASRRSETALRLQRTSSPNVMSLFTNS